LSSRHLSANIKIKIYKTVILPIVLYWCETLSVTLREAHRFGVSENRVLRRIFVPKSEEVAGGWRRLHNDAWAVLVPLRLGSSIFRQETDAKE